MDTLLANPISDLKDSYGVVVIGSGYGGAILAARLAQGRSLCILERGREGISGTLLMKMVKRPAHWDVAIYHTDQWGTYAAVLPQDKLVQSKTGTGRIERHQCRQCHWFGRFKRKSIIVSISLEMVDLTMALFAKFWVNGAQDELISLLC